MKNISTYKDLIVWQKSITLAQWIYKFTENLPKSQQYSLIDQMQRSAVSIPSNIAEGYGRNYTKEYKHFLSVAYGSSAELETQMILAGKIYSIENQKINNLITEVQKMLATLIKRLNI